MAYTIVGLGNPGEEYEGTRHNTGRILLDHLAKTFDFSHWEHDKKLNAEVSEGKLGKHKVTLIKPDTFMNKSGVSVKKVVTNIKQAEQLAVVYDDIDLPVGKLKVSFNRGSGGHRGLDSIIKSLKTKKFVRVRVGISPVTPSGKTKKPLGEERVLKFLMSDFSKSELEKLKGVRKKVSEAIETLVLDGRQKAMNFFN